MALGLVPPTDAFMGSHQAGDNPLVLHGVQQCLQA